MTVTNDIGFSGMKAARCGHDFLPRQRFKEKFLGAIIMVIDD